MPKEWSVKVTVNGAQPSTLSVVKVAPSGVETSTSMVAVTSYHMLPNLHVVLGGYVGRSHGLCEVGSLRVLSGHQR